MKSTLNDKTLWEIRSDVNLYFQDPFTLHPSEAKLSMFPNLSVPLLVTGWLLPFPYKEAEMSSDIKIPLPLCISGVASLPPFCLWKEWSTLAGAIFLGFCSYALPLQFDHHAPYTEMNNLVCSPKGISALDSLDFWKFRPSLSRFPSLLSLVFCEQTLLIFSLSLWRVLLCFFHGYSL